MLNKDNINIDFEKDMLETHLKIQSFFKKNILVYMEKISDNAINSFNSLSGDLAYTYLTKIKPLLNKVDENIANINILKNELNNYSNELSDYDLITFISTYNDDYIRYMKIITQNTLDIQNSLNELSNYIKFDFSLFSKTDLCNYISDTPIIKPVENTQYEESKENLETETKDLKENVLLISDIKQKVVLPYYISELEKILNHDSKYKNIQEIIDKKYTIPISYYKNPAIARFKEAYSLVKKRSSGSTKDAFNLGLEVFFKSDLNPAIITACKDINELDIYISCLDDNELDNFKCFEITYESFPTVQYQN